MTLAEGTRIDGRYTIQKLIGEGGMANVYLAMDIILNREVAIKILHEQLAKQERFIERFRREAEAVASIIHPNVVEIYDVGQYDNCYFIVMELLEGQTLKEYVKDKGTLSVSETLTIMKQVCEGVDVAHKLGIVHRDLKPQNIFIREDGLIKIMDFGIAYQQDASPLTQTNAVMGSVHYLSPEQAKGESATIQTDIYSLGIVMYEMLTGSVPYTGDSAVNIVLRHLRETVPYVSEKNEHVPQSVENIIIRATAKNPDDRYHSLADMRYDLDTALNVERMNEPRVYFENYEDEDTKREIELLENSGEFATQEQTLVSETEAENKGKLSKKKLAIIISAVVAAVVVIGSFVFYGLANSKVTEMPDIINKTVEEAKTLLTEKELKLGTLEEVASDTVAAGKIVSADKQASEKLDKGTTINVKVSKGKVVTLENYVGKNIDEVKASLDGLGIKYKVEMKEPSGSEEDGTILAQSMTEGQEFLLAKDTVVLTVAQKEEFALADLVGYTQAAANGYATENGLELQIEYEYSDDVPAGTVIRMSDYWPNRKVKKGDTISIVVSKGKDPEKEKPEPPTTTSPQVDD